MRPWRFLAVLILMPVFGALLSSSSSCHYSSSHHGHDHNSHHHHDSHSHGEVVVFVGDHPIDDLVSCFVSITEIALLSEELGSTSLYASDAGHRIDLLSLRGSATTRLYELLVPPTDIPAASYHGARLSLRDPALVLHNGEIVEGSEIDLVGGGEVEVRFAEPLRWEDDLLTLLFDIDVEQSLHRESGVRNGWRMSPVVLPEVGGEELREGTRTRVDVSGRLWDLEPESDLFELELAGGRGSLEIVIPPEAVVLDLSLEQGGLERGGFFSLRPGSEATVRGGFDPEGRFVVRSIVLGELVSVTGTIGGFTPAGEGGTLILEADPGQPIGGELFWRVEDAALLSLRRGERASFLDLHPGVRAVVTGKLTRNGIARVALLDLQPPRSSGGSTP